MADASLHSTPREPRSLAESLFRRVQARHIYADFPRALYPLDLQRGNSLSPVFRRLMREVRPRCVVELGTWKGGSALHMCDLAEEAGLSSCVVVCVDTWLGGPRIGRSDSGPMPIRGWPVGTGFPRFLSSFSPM